MRKILALAFAAGAVAAGTAPASADTCFVPASGATYVTVCRERNGEYLRYYATCSLDTDGDGQADARCTKIYLIEHMG